MTGIYCIENTVNGNKYVGQAINIEKRWNHHRQKLRNGTHCNIHLQRAWNSYGENAFNFYVLELCDKYSLNNREQYYIKSLGSYENGYNMTLGGEGTRGCFHTEEYKKHMSNIFSGRTYTEETLERMRKAKLGHLQIETEARKAGRKIVSEKLKGRIRSPEHCKNLSESLKGNIPWNKGMKMPEDYVSPKLGTHLSAETKAKLSAAQTGRKKSTEEKLKVSKRIICSDTQEVFNSITLAAEKYGVTISAVSRALRGKSKTCTGLHWGYVSEEVMS